MVEMAIRNATQEAIYDRSYRIRNNTNQVYNMVYKKSWNPLARKNCILQMTTDRFAFCGAVLGSGASLMIGKGLLPGLFSGFAFGTLSAGAYNTALKKWIKACDIISYSLTNRARQLNSRPARSLFKLKSAFWFCTTYYMLWFCLAAILRGRTWLLCFPLKFKNI